MRRPSLVPVLALLLASAACDNPTEPTTFSVVGSWVSADPDSLQIRMTISETARTISGAGNWMTPNRVLAFRVTGAHVARRISLLLDFDDAPDINFYGEFEETASDTLTILGGRLYGGGGFRGLPIVFVRRESP